MNELDAIQQQMADLGIDVSPSAQPEAPMYDEASMLTPEDEAMFASWGEYAIPEEMPMEAMPMEWEMPMATWIEEIQQAIAPMIQWLNKEQFADLVVWMASMQQPMM